MSMIGKMKAAASSDKKKKAGADKAPRNSSKKVTKGKKC